MDKLKKTKVIPGVYWVEIEEAGVSILCGCPEDGIKHLMQRGLIQSVRKNGVDYETGPNVILLSDVPIQNGAFCNLAEFPVLQMLYRQGMILPNHPNNTGVKPLLIGSEEQIQAQMRYIYRGNYGLTSKDEILAAGESDENAELIMRMKLRFAFGEILETEELLDNIVIQHTPTDIRNGVSVRRKAVNVFEFSYDGETTTIDLNLNQGQKYRSSYPLGFQNISREYFAVIHSGQGDGWDVNRPCMSSIITYQGNIYLIDAGPHIDYSLTALGIGVNEVEGIFHTHCHDDHFSGLTTLMRADHRIKYFATPLVRSSVFKKLAALLSREEELFYDYFDVQDLDFNEWNDIQGLEVRPVLSPHPVETSVFFFRTFWEGRYQEYAHLADIASFDVLKGMIEEDDTVPGISQEYFDTVQKEYLTEVDLKKIDIGGGLIHGQAEDFQEDSSDKIILAHQYLPLTSSEKEIGSSAPFGMVDILIPDQSDNVRRFAFEFLRAYFPDIDRYSLRTLLNNPIVEFMPGTIILKKGQVNDNIFLVLTGLVEQIDSDENVYTMVSAGGLVGEHSGMNAYRSKFTYRTVGFAQALRLPSKSYLEFINKNDLYRQIERMNENRQFLEQSWLFGESISPSVHNKIADSMVAHSYPKANEIIEVPNPSSVYVIKSGSCLRLVSDMSFETLEPGNFFGEEQIVDGGKVEYQCRTVEPTVLYEIPENAVRDIPVVLWKLLETMEKRAK